MVSKAQPRLHQFLRTVRWMTTQISPLSELLRSVSLTTKWPWRILRKSRNKSILRCQWVQFPLLTRWSCLRTLLISHLAMIWAQLRLTLVSSSWVHLPQIWLLAEKDVTYEASRQSEYPRRWLRPMAARSRPNLNYWMKRMITTLIETLLKSLRIDASTKRWRVKTRMALNTNQLRSSLRSSVTHALSPSHRPLLQLPL